MNRLIPIVAGCVILAIALSGCNSFQVKIHNVKLSADCVVVDTDDNRLEELSVTPGDIICWENERSTAEKILLDTTVPFGKTEIILRPGETVCTVVLMGSKSDAGWSLGLSCDDGGVGAPKLKVGDDPVP